MPKKRSAKPRRIPAETPTPDAATPSRVSQFVVFRETIESIVVAFVLAFLFRTFEAEAFVIPTGSMSPSLHGRHKDVECTQCGWRFRTSASSEDVEDQSRPSQFRSFDDAEVVGGMCPMCRFPMPFTSKLPRTAQDDVDELTPLDDIETQTSYPGDRILVNKYGFDFREPQRWDVVVFKFPGDGNMNYIKRLVGMPGEELQVFQGDIFTRPLASRNEFKIERKPPDKVAAMLELVHDTDYESATLRNADWPLRWAATTPGGWVVEEEAGEKTVQQRFVVDLSQNSPEAWLRYRHQVPHGSDDWAVANAIARGTLGDLALRHEGAADEARAAFMESIRPELITDFNSYNARIHRLQLKQGERWSQAMDRYLGWNWVSDLAVECDVEVEEARGQLILDVVEAGYHFRATIDLKSGEARLGIVDGRTGAALAFSSTAKSPLTAPGKYQVRLANVDDQILLWVDGKLVKFETSAYDPEELFPEGRQRLIPWASEDENGDQGDLAPAGVGAVGAKLAVSRLAVLRDAYYIATNEAMGSDAMLMDYDTSRVPPIVDGRMIERLENGRELFARPSKWLRFRTRRKVRFPISDQQLFVMGDNSPESADCRLWVGSDDLRGVPGGRYLDRRLLIGKAVCVFWPHSWGSIPGAPILPGWPNFGDMRLVR